MATATETGTEERAALKVDVPAELRQQVKIRAATEGLTMRDYVASVLRRGLEDGVQEDGS